MKLKGVHWSDIFSYLAEMLCFTMTTRKNSINTDSSALNIQSLAHLSAFSVDGKSTRPNSFPAFTFLWVKAKRNQSPSLSWEPAPGCRDAQKAVWGIGTPRSRHCRAGESGRSHPLRHCCWYCAQSCWLVWGQQQPDLSFPEPQHVVSQHRGGKGEGGRGICLIQTCPLKVHRLS